MTEVPKGHRNLVEDLAEHCDFGHSKRDLAFLRQVQLLTASGVATPSEACATPKNSNTNLVSLYRFARNPGMEVSSLREVRRDLVLGQLPDAQSQVLLIHDPTLLDYTRHNSKKDRRAIGDHRAKGYEYLPTIAVDAQNGYFLGVIHDCVVNDQGPDDAEVIDYDYEPLWRGFSAKEKARLKVNHRHQLAAHVHCLAEELKLSCQPINVADMEFDDVFLMLNCQHQRNGFVFRTQGNRSVQVRPEPWMNEQTWSTANRGGHEAPPGWEHSRLDILAEQVPLRPYKTLKFDKENRLVQGNHKPAREVRTGIASLRVRLYRPAKRNHEHLFLPPEPLEVNVVVIRQMDPVQAGQKPVLWILLTNLPVDTPEQQERVGWIYEQRWSVEEYIRLLKSGYRVEQLRLQDAQKVARWLVVVSIAAMAVMQLKAHLELPAGGYLDDDSYQKIKHATRNLNDNNLDVNLRLFALVVGCGGWLGRRNDPIGPLILMRGMNQVLAMLAFAEQCKDLLQHARDSPNCFGSLFCVQ